MGKFAIKHKHGFLVESFGSPFVNVAGSFKTAMTFSSRESAQKTVDYLNSITVKNGQKEKVYSVCEKSQYKKPSFLKRKKVR